MIYHIIYELHQAKRGLMVILKILWGTFQLSITMKVFIDFLLIPLKIQCYSILQKRLSRMFDISNCDVIYYVIYVICSHYVGKAISPLFAWPSSYILLEEHCATSITFIFRMWIWFTDKLCNGIICSLLCLCCGVWWLHEVKKAVWINRLEI